MQCWNCGAPLSNERITFRASCAACRADIHCCKGCKFYKPGLPNDCMVPGSETIRERSKSNLCEEFSFLGKYMPIPSADSAKKRFDDLFKP